MRGAHVKDLSGINRNIKRVILVESDPAAYQLQVSWSHQLFYVQVENTIPIKPFTDGSDVADTALIGLTPFLRGL